MAEFDASESVPVRRVSESDIVPLAFSLCRALHDNPSYRYVFNDPDAFEQDVVAVLAAQMSAARRSAPASAAFCGGDTAGAAFWYRAPGPIAMDPVGLRTAGVYERSRELSDAYRWMIPTDAHILLALVGVDPSNQRAGIGSALLDVAFSHADQHGVPVLTVTSDSEAASWLVLQGFDPVGVTVSEPDGIPEQTVLRRNPLAS